MKISIITTCTINTPHRKDPWQEALKCYLAFADEVVVVTGHKDDNAEIMKNFYDDVTKGKLILKFVEWPYKWTWDQLPKSYNEALAKATGDVILRFDIDYFIHENDFEEFRNKLENFSVSNKPIGMTLKVNIFNKYQGLVKSRNPNVISKVWKHKVRFGKAVNKVTDWLVPTINWGNCKSPSYSAMDEKDMPLLDTWIYNYDYFFATQEDVKEEFWRFAQAYATKDDLEEDKKYSWGRTKDEAWKIWSNMMKGRLKRAGEEIEGHPVYIQDRINQMDEKQWGHSNFNLK